MNTDRRVKPFEPEVIERERMKPPPRETSTSVLPDEAPPFLGRLLRATGAGVVFGALLGSGAVYWQAYEQTPGVPLRDTASASGAAGASGVRASFGRLRLPMASSPAPVALSPWASVTRHAALFAAIGATYTVGEGLMEAVRGEQQDVWNGAVGGCAAGAVLGVRTASAPTALGACVLFAAFSALMDSQHGSLMPQRDLSDMVSPQRRPAKSS
ncbi:hypothetical protein CDCA_CDCA18G4489 [Cyanidium caldarium]|uniref:NADH-ubiquinone oxidoreductase subunit B14.7 n=1 Tax=Cyanidium caldarium TaxID=2771 RepID=A0AAV9J1P3_CYACA|nr:hypothetical protein CDCA_CDCA18G4489 [Cyanidium caldarium]